MLKGISTTLSKSKFQMLAKKPQQNTEKLETIDDEEKDNLVQQTPELQSRKDPTLKSTRFSILGSMKKKQ